MRIISGTAKGTRLAVPKNRSVRPTLDRVREALFSILGPAVQGSVFLDLFAGTGANGIEAISRGATHCDFVESDSCSREVIRENLKKTGFLDSACILSGTLPSDPKLLVNLCDPYDFIFADPPRSMSQTAELFSVIGDQNLLKTDGIFILERPTQVKSVGPYAGFSLIRSSKYGNTTLAFYRQTDAPTE